MIDLSVLRPPETAPKDGRQFLAWATNDADKSRGESVFQPVPRWVICQWAASYQGGVPYWQWSVPGYLTSVTIIGWLDVIPWLDVYGDAAVRGAVAWDEYEGQSQGHANRVA